MKLHAVALVLALAASSYAQSQAPSTRPATGPATLPASTIEAYIQQIRALYNVPGNVSITTSGAISLMGGPGNPSPSASVMKAAELLSSINEASQAGIPLDVIENVGDARARFLNDAEANLKKSRDTASDLLGSGEGFPSAGALAEKRASLKAQKDKAQMELEVKQAKEKSIQDRIAALTQQIAKTTENDEVLKSLRALETTQQKQLEHMRNLVQIGRVTAAELGTAEAGLASTSIEIAKRPAEIADTAAGGALGVLNRLLIEVSLEVDEQKATIRVADAHLDVLKRAQEANKQAVRIDSQMQVLSHLRDRENAAAASPSPQP
jgi:hypothetical protein